MKTFLSVLIIFPAALLCACTTTGSFQAYGFGMLRENLRQYCWTQDSEQKRDECLSGVQDENGAYTNKGKADAANPP